MRKILSISTTDQNEYAFYLPICIWVHEKLHGYKTVFFTVGDEAKLDWICKYIDDTGHIRVHIPDTYGYRDATISQIARLFAYQHVSAEDQIYIGDVDMFQFSALPDCNVYGSNLVSNDQYPMQYTNFTGGEWARMMSDHMTYESFLAYYNLSPSEQDFNKYWFVDQVALKAMTKRHGQPVKAAPRRMPGGLPYGRVDRAGWAVPGDKRRIIDAHLCRPGHTDENFARLMSLLRLYFTERDLQWIIDYRHDYIQQNY